MAVGRPGTPALSLHRVALPCLLFGDRSAANDQVNQTSHVIGRVELDGDGQKSAIGDGRMTGTIRTLRVDKGFGFIKGETGQDYFFHQSAIYGEGIADLREGDGVEFEVADSPKGPRAANVKRTTT
ncbi:MAG: cold-shock protein [Betaproteobacteria bacterium]